MAPVWGLGCSRKLGEAAVVAGLREYLAAGTTSTPRQDKGHWLTIKQGLQNRGGRDSE